MILGSGWGGFKLLRDMDKNAYQVVAVSPRYVPSCTTTTLCAVLITSLFFAGLDRQTERERDRVEQQQLNVVMTSKLHYVHH